MSTIQTKKIQLGPIKKKFSPWDTDEKPLLELVDVNLDIDGNTIIDNLSLKIYSREFFALLGPSGCGKTTLLRMIAGFQKPTSGKILLEGINIVDYLPHERPVNMMFQSYALFPHLSVFDNIAFGLRRQKMPEADIKLRVEELLTMIKLSGFEKRKPHQLSGGQQQRVALARSIARKPKILLLDEPMAALDKQLRTDTQFELMDIQYNLGITFIMVTHDQDEAMVLSDRMVIMQKGKFAQLGTPSEIYEQPKNVYAAKFLGDINILEGNIVSESESSCVFEYHNTDKVMNFVVNNDSYKSEKGAIQSKVYLSIRPEKIDLSRNEPTDEAVNKVKGIIWDIGYLGEMSIFRIKLSNGDIMQVHLMNDRRYFSQPFKWDEEVWCYWDTTEAVILHD